jgi:hypothetical protein
LVSVIDEISEPFPALIRRAKKTNNFPSTAEGVALDACKPSLPLQVVAAIVVVALSQCDVTVIQLIVRVVVIRVIVRAIVIQAIIGVVESCRI